MISNFHPKNDEKYWTIDGRGLVWECPFLNDDWDHWRLQHGIVFKTEKEATEFRDIGNLNAEIRNALKEANGDWVADWKDESQHKLYIEYYDHEGGAALIEDFCSLQATKYVAKSGKILLELIDKYGDKEVCRAFGIIDY